LPAGQLNITVEQGADFELVFNWLQGLGGTPVIPLTTLVSDSFSGSADGTALQSHIGETGATWTRHPATGTNNETIDAGRVHSGNNVGASYYAAGVPAGPDYEVDGRFYMAGDNSGITSIRGRLDTAADTSYALQLSRGNPAPNCTWGLYRISAGTSVLLDSFTVTPCYPAGSVHDARLSMHGSLIRGYADGALVVEATDTNITAAGRAGLGGAFNQVGAGIHLDSFDAKSSGWNAVAQVRKHHASDFVLLGLDVAMNDGGQFIISAPAADTDPLIVGGVWDLKLTELATGRILRLVNGHAKLSRKVTP
jgi:hypothetical protein